MKVISEANKTEEQSSSPTGVQSMFKHVKNALRDGKVFNTEADLRKYLNSLRGYLTRAGLLKKTWPATQGRILSLYRQGKLKASEATAK